MNRALVGTLSLLLLAACGGYDGDYDCEQTAACRERIEGQPVTDTEIDLCADISEGAYDRMSDIQQDYVDDVFDECSDEESCAFYVCMCDYSGSTEPDCDAARQHL